MRLGVGLNSAGCCPALAVKALLFYKIMRETVADNTGVCSPGVKCCQGKWHVQYGSTATRCTSLLIMR